MDRIEDMQALTDTLDRYADSLFVASVDHGDECWREHEACAIYRAVDLMSRWTAIECGEHRITFLAPECPACRTWPDE